MTADVWAPIRLYKHRWCGHCFAARRLFSSLGVDFEEIPLDGNPSLRREIADRAGGWPTVPMIFVGERLVGGYQKAAALHHRGEQERLFNPE